MVYQSRYRIVLSHEKNCQNTSNAMKSKDHQQLFPFKYRFIENFNLEESNP